MKCDYMIAKDVTHIGHLVIGGSTYHKLSVYQLHEYRYKYRISE